MSRQSTVEDELRGRLERATTDVPGAPDLAATITRGRRRRAVRHGAAVMCGVTGAAVVATAGVAGFGVWQRPEPPRAGPAGAAAVATDWVIGTTVDETMAKVVTDHVARPGVTTSIHPSDWTRSTPLPDSEVARATEWQAHFRVDGEETLTVLMSQRPTDAPVGPPLCGASTLVVDGGGTRLKTNEINPGGQVKVVPEGSAEAGASCVASRTSGGVLVVNRDERRATATFWRPGDATVVTATSALGSGDASAVRRVTDAELERVVTDPRLTFAHVADPPAWPADNGPGWPAGL